MSSSIWHLLYRFTMPSNAFCMTTVGIIIAAFSHCCHRKLPNSDWPQWVRYTLNPVFDATLRETKFLITKSGDLRGRSKAPR